MKTLAIIASWMCYIAGITFWILHNPEDAKICLLMAIYLNLVEIRDNTDKE